MGVVNTISYEKYPKQDTSSLFKVGTRVAVCYHYDSSKTHTGTIVRNDEEEPYQTIIQLDNGRYVLATECQYGLLN